MENTNDILEVEVELTSGEKETLSIQECDNWYDIKEPMRALIILINNETMLVNLHEADEDEGVFFTYIGSDRKLCYDANTVAKIYTEVKS